MKLIAYEVGRASWMGVVTLDGRVEPVTELESFYADVPGSLAVARTALSGGLALAEVRLVPAVPCAARIFCVGLNYRAHATESDMDVSPHPTIFARWRTSLSTDGAPIPAIDNCLDWEGELAAVIGVSTSRISEADALAHVFGYAPFNDISARSYQWHSSQWTLGKNADRCGPLGALITADAVGDPRAGLQLITRHNGEIVQQANTRDMIYTLPRVISYISQITDLHPGDVIATGTPEGVGFARKPPVFMRPGDVIEVEIEKVGRLFNSVVGVDKV